MKKSSKVILITLGIILLVGLVAGLLFLIPTKQVSIPSGEYIQAPTFMYYECTPASKKISSDWTTIPTGSYSVTCPKNSDTCDIDIKPTQLSSFWAEYIIYKKCSIYDVCEPEVKTEVGDGRTISLYNIRKDQKVIVRGCTGFLCRTGLEGIQVKANYNPFILWKVGMFSGGKTEYTTMKQGCIFPTSDKGDLIKQVLDLSRSLATQTSTTTYELEPYKTRNFIEMFVPLSKENVNFVNYNGRDGYCLNRNIYSIATVQTESTTYRIVDVNWNNMIKQGVICCPNEKEPTRKCGDDFEWHPISGSECSYFNPCAGADWYPSGKPKELIIYNCENGYCVPTTKIVECTSDNDCISSSKGKYCDTKTWECTGIPPPNITKAEICDNGIDDDGDGLIDLDDPDCEDGKKCGWWVTIPKTPFWDEQPLIPNLWCLLNNFLAKFKIVFAIVVGFLSGLFGTLTANKFMEKQELKKKWWILLLTFLVLGGAVSFLAWTYFWIAFILLIIFIAIKIFI